MKLVSIVSDNAAHREESMARYIFTRGNSFHCRYPVPGFNHSGYALGIYTTGSASDFKRCQALCEQLLAKIRTWVSEGKKFRIENGSLIDTTEWKKEEEPYNPSFCALALNYWFFHLKNKKSGANEIFHLRHSWRRFGPRPAREIFRDDVQLWLDSQKAAGYSVAAINNQLAYFRRVYSIANSEGDPRRRLGHDPTIGLDKRPRGKVRTFLLTPEKFERNYQYLLDGEKWPNGKPDKHCTPYRTPPAPRFALFYLLLWETGRRPEEASQYTWEMVNSVEMDGREVRFFCVPPELAKTETFDNVIISDRLWNEMKQLAYRKGYVCRNAKGERWQYWDRYKRSLEAKYGADGGWIRDTRRGFVTRKIVSEGHAEHDVMAQSGHRTRETVKRYRIDQLRNQARVMVSGQPAGHQAAV